MRIYLAGPDVFHADAAGLGATKKALCARFGFVGLYPLDAPPPEAPCSESASSASLASDALSQSGAIYAACLAMLRAADCGIFNLTPFRGPSADVGTVFELGLMVGHGKPVFAYSNVARDLIDRLRDTPGLSRDVGGACWRDPAGMMAEDFGNADNLMLDETLVAQGRRVHRRDVSEGARFTDLAGFVACLEDAAAFARSRATR